jgi:hypothetical protein
MFDQLQSTRGRGGGGGRRGGREKGNSHFGGGGGGGESMSLIWVGLGLVGLLLFHVLSKQALLREKRRLINSMGPLTVTNSLFGGVSSGTRLSRTIRFFRARVRVAEDWSSSASDSPSYLFVLDQDSARQEDSLSYAVSTGQVDVIVFDNQIMGISERSEDESRTKRESAERKKESEHERLFVAKPLRDVRMFPLAFTRSPSTSTTDSAPLTNVLGYYVSEEHA